MNNNNVETVELSETEKQYPNEITLLREYATKYKESYITGPTIIERISFLEYHNVPIDVVNKIVGYGAI